jgi:hypothetical protein
MGPIAFDEAAVGGMISGMLGNHEGKRSGVPLYIRLLQEERRINGAVGIQLPNPDYGD